MRRDRTEVDQTLAGRTVTALGSLFISIPVCGLLWLLLNYLLASTSAGGISVSLLIAAIVGVTAFTFLFPRTAPDLFAGLIDALFKLGR